MEEKIRSLQVQIAEIQEKIEEINTLKKLTEAQYQKTVSEDSEKIQKLKSIAATNLQELMESDPKRAAIENKINMFEKMCAKKSQEILGDIVIFAEKIEEYANNSALLTKQMIELHSSS